jgi:hypothetical protein
MRAHEFRLIGGALRACERWSRATQRDRSSDLKPEEVEAAHEAMLQLVQARALLAALAPYLRSEHEVFIGVSLWRGIRSVLGKKRDWTRPDLTRSALETGVERSNAGNAAGRSR